MSNFEPFDTLYNSFGTGNVETKDRLKEIFNNPGNYTLDEIKSAYSSAFERPTYGGPINRRHYRNIGSDDDDWVQNKNAVAADMNRHDTALNSLLINAKNNSSAPVAAATAAPTSPTPPKSKLRTLTGGRGDNSGSDPTPGSDADPTRYMGMTPAEYEDYLFNRQTEKEYGLGNQDARSRALIQDLRNQSAKEVASITSAATMYGDDRRFDIADVTSRRDKEARMYVADVQGLATTDKAKIDGAFGVKMQKIIANGAKDVEKIRGEYGLAGQQIAGEYGLERDRIQGATARDVANRNRDAQIFGSLMSGFWS
jgi:hypothetical protein